MRTRKDYLKKLDSLIRKMESELDSIGPKAKKVSLDKRDFQDFLEFFQELTDMYSEGMVTPGSDEHKALRAKEKEELVKERRRNKAKLDALIAEEEAKDMQEVKNT